MRRSAMRGFNLGAPENRWTEAGRRTAREICHMRCSASAHCVSGNGTVRGEGESEGIISSIILQFCREDPIFTWALRFRPTCRGPLTLLQQNVWPADRRLSSKTECPKRFHGRASPTQHASAGRDLADLTAVVTGSSQRHRPGHRAGIGRGRRPRAGPRPHQPPGRRRSGPPGPCPRRRVARRAVRPGRPPPRTCRLVEAAWNWRGAVDIWVNNAGADVLTGEPAAAGPSSASWTNCGAWTSWPRWRSRAPSAARMTARGTGTIINIGWDQAERDWPATAASCSPRPRARSWPSPRAWPGRWPRRCA